MTAPEVAARHAAMPAETWLAAADRRRRHDIVIVWGRHPEQTAILPCGVRWDAVKVPARIGLPVLDVLLDGDDRHSIGPVLQDHRTGDTYWLIPIEADNGHWDDLPGVQLLSVNHHLGAPAPTCRDAWPAEWIYWPRTTGTRTPPRLLAAALKATADTRTAP